MKGEKDVKKHMNRWTSLFLALVLCLGVVFAGSVNQARADELPADISRHEVITMYLIGDPPPEVNEVYGKVNEILNEKLNAELNVKWISWGDAGTKYSLLFSGSEDFDMIFTASGWGYLESTISMGGFLEMDEEFVKKYAPDIWASIPSIGWKQATFNDAICVIPANYVDVTPDCLAIRGDWMKELGYEDITNWDELISFYRDVAKSGRYAAQDGNLYWTWFQQMGYAPLDGSPNGNTLMLYNSNDPSDTEIKYVLDWDAFRDFCVEMKELCAAGAWPTDFLNSGAERMDGILNGRCAVMVWNSGSCQMYGDQANSVHPEWDFNVYNVMPGVKFNATKYTNNAMGINYASKHPERTLMVLNEIQSNPEIQDLIALGLEGVHWEKVGDNQYKKIGDGYAANNYWGLRNRNMMRTEYNENPTPAQQKVEALNAQFQANVKTEPHPLDGFHFDNTNVSVQFAAVEAAAGTYFNSLLGGLVDDVDQALAEYKNVLEAAGIRDVIEEMNRQAAEYMNSSN